GLLLSSIVAPTNAWASCGDYVQRGTKAGAHGANMSQGNHSLPTLPGMPRSPCSGPNCSRGSQGPLVPVPTIPPSPTHWAIDVPSVPLISNDPVSISPIASSLHPVQLRFSVFHPPRVFGC